MNCNRLAIALIALSCMSSFGAYAGPIHDAVKTANMAEVKKLIKEDPLKLDEQDSDGNTPLHLAIASGYNPIISFLIKNYADQKIKNRLGLTPLQLLEQPEYAFPKIAAHLKAAEAFLAQYRPLSRPVLIAVHQTRAYAPDADIPGSTCSSYVSASNELISQINKLGLPIAFITSKSLSVDEWATGRGIEPTFSIPSESGGHPLRIEGGDVVMIGANWGRCHLHATTMAIAGHFAHSRRPFTVHLPVDAIHTARPPEKTELPPEDVARYLKHLTDEEKVTEVEQTLLPEKTLTWGDDGFQYDPQEYKFKIFMEGKAVKTVGTGAKLVNLKIWNKFDPEKHIGKDSFVPIPEECRDESRFSHGTGKSLWESIRRECFGDDRSDNLYLPEMYPGIEFGEVSDFGSLESFGISPFRKHPRFGGNEATEVELQQSLLRTIEEYPRVGTGDWVRFAPKEESPKSLALKKVGDKLWIRCERAFAGGGLHSVHSVFETSLTPNVVSRADRRLVNIRAKLDYSHPGVQELFRRFKKDPDIHVINESNGSKIFEAIQMGRESGVGIAVPIGPFNASDRTYERFDMDLSELSKSPTGVTHFDLVRALYELAQGMEVIDRYGRLGDFKPGNILVRRDADGLHAVWHDLTLSGKKGDPSIWTDNLENLRTLANSMNLSQSHDRETDFRGVARDQKLGTCVDGAIGVISTKGHFTTFELAQETSQRLLGIFRERLSKCMTEHK